MHLKIFLFYLVFKKKKKKRMVIFFFLKNNRKQENSKKKYMKIKKREVDLCHCIWERKGRVESE